MAYSSKSDVQTAAEEPLRVSAAELLLAELMPRKIHLPGGSFVQVDAVSDSPPILGEIFARVGRLRGGQIKKVAEDALKLVTVRSAVPGWASARLVLIFASEEASASVAGWLAEALAYWRVETLTVEIHETMRQRLIDAQLSQTMQSPEGSKFVYSDEDLQHLEFHDAEGRPIPAEDLLRRNLPPA